MRCERAARLRGIRDDARRLDHRGSRASSSSSRAAQQKVYLTGVFFFFVRVCVSLCVCECVRVCVCVAEGDARRRMRGDKKEEELYP